MTTPRVTPLTNVQMVGMDGCRRSTSRSALFLPLPRSTPHPGDRPGDCPGNPTRPSPACRAWVAKQAARHCLRRRRRRRGKAPLLAPLRRLHRHCVVSTAPPLRRRRWSQWRRRNSDSVAAWTAARLTRQAGEGCPLSGPQTPPARRMPRHVGSVRSVRVRPATAQLGPASHARCGARGGAGKCCSTGPRPRHAWGRAACCPWWATACALDPLHARWGGSTLSGAAPLTLHCRHGRPSKRQHRLRACHEVSVMAAWTAGGGGSVSDTCFLRN